MGKKVPLVIYRNGKRIVVGEAELDSFGTIFAKITDEELVKCFEFPAGDFSINWRHPFVEFTRNEVEDFDVGFARWVDAAKSEISLPTDVSAVETTISLGETLASVGHTILGCQICGGGLCEMLYN